MGGLMKKPLAETNPYLKGEEGALRMELSVLTSTAIEHALSIVQKERLRYIRRRLREILHRDR
jgi:hypothetical protein